MVKKNMGFSIVEIAMVAVVVAIISVVALPNFFTQSPGIEGQSPLESSINKVRSAYAFSIANKSGFPTISEVVAFIDADFAMEMNDRSGIIFRDNGKQVMVNTFNDIACSKLTNKSKPGTSDIVRCIQESRSL